MPEFDAVDLVSKMTISSTNTTTYMKTRESCLGRQSVYKLDRGNPLRTSILKCAREIQIHGFSTCLPTMKPAACLRPSWGFECSDSKSKETSTSALFFSFNLP